MIHTQGIFLVDILTWYKDQQSPIYLKNKSDKNLIDELIRKLKSVRNKFYTEYMLRSVRSDFGQYTRIFKNVWVETDHKENFMKASRSVKKPIHRNMLEDWFNDVIILFKIFFLT